MAQPVSTAPGRRLTGADGPWKEAERWVALDAWVSSLGQGGGTDGGAIADAPVDAAVATTADTASFAVDWQLPPWAEER